MSYTNVNEPKKKDNNKTIIALLLASTLGMGGYIVYDKTQDKKVEVASIQKDVVIKNLDSAKNLLQIEFNIASSKVDTLTANNAQLQGVLGERNSEIIAIKSKISSILKKGNATNEELAEAKNLIAQLNGKIDDLVVEVGKLKGENEQLTTEKNVLTTEKNDLTTDKKNLEDNLQKTETIKKNLEDKVDVASTLHASNINITSMKMKGSDAKETETAKRVEFFRVSFILDENRVAQSGKKNIYVLITNPDGTASSTEGNFKARDGADIMFTNKIEVNYEQGKVTPVSFDWKPGAKFEIGEYKIEIYNNGFKIGEGKKYLKKGGLFS
jgi:hypothetical protein